MKSLQRLSENSIITGTYPGKGKSKIQWTRLTRILRLQYKRITCSLKIHVAWRQWNDEGGIQGWVVRCSFPITEDLRHELGDLHWTFYRNVGVGKNGTLSPLVQQSICYKGKANLKSGHRGIIYIVLLKLPRICKSTRASHSSVGKKPAWYIWDHVLRRAWWYRSCGRRVSVTELWIYSESQLGN